MAMLLRLYFAAYILLMYLVQLGDMCRHVCVCMHACMYAQCVFILNITVTEMAIVTMAHE